MRNLEASQPLVRAKLYSDSDATLSSASSASDVGHTSTYFSQDLSPFDEQPDEEEQEDFLATNGVSGEG